MIRQRVVGVAALMLLAVATGCRDNGTEPADLPSAGEVFLDQYGSGVTFQAFAGSKLDAVQIDQVEVHEGTAALRVTVPGPNDGSGTYAGGAFTTDIPRDLTEFDALTFWAKASTAATLNVAGLGNDNTETSQFTAERGGIPLTTTWTKYVIPIPLASKLGSEDGLFYFAEGAEGDQGYTIWFDEIQYETLGTLANPRPAIAEQDVSVEVGGTATVSGTAVTYDVAGTDITVSAMPGYFTFTSSAESVATVDVDGVITVVGEGTATITAALGETAAAGSVVITAVAPPASAAPTPTTSADSVISLFSDAYTDVTVDTWSASWDDADVADVTVDGNAAKRYSDLVFAGIEFTSAPVDASDMNYFHMDIWTPDETDSAAFKIKLVDFGADGAYGGGDDVESELTFTTATDPALATGSWVSIDVPLSDFAGLTTKAALAQMILTGVDMSTVYVDNIYFYMGEVTAPNEPTEAAPTPTAPADSVISLFSDAYTDVTVDRWSTDWDNATVTDATVAGNAVKLYTGLVFAGIEATSSPIDASAMNRFHMDIWTPDPTAAPAAFKVKLVDAGADGVIGTGGDDSEQELAFTASTDPALATGSWVSIDVPLSQFTGLTGTGAIAQLIISGDPNTVYVDNVYFYVGAVAAPNEPNEAAPTPTEPADSVISLFSDAYTDVTVDRWSTDWDNVTLTDATVAGNAVKLYTNLVFAGIEATSSPIDASAMTHFHMDIWTPDATAEPVEFKVKLVDAGADGVIGTGGDDVEQELIFTAATDPALATGSWVSMDVPLSEFVGLTTKGAIAQLIISGDLSTVYVDNVYFHN